MQPAHANPRADLAALCARGIEWRTVGTRVLPDTSVPRDAAVLVLFGVLDRIRARQGSALQDAVWDRSAHPHPVPADLDVLLLRRAATLRDHGGQIAFPGGGVDVGDADALAAALREAEEETGVDPVSVEVLGALPQLPLAVSNFMVTPVVGWWQNPSAVVAVDHAETVEVFRMPVAEMLDPANRVSTEHGSGERSVRLPAFVVDGRLVWGFTALVLSRLYEELGWALPWDESRLVDPYAAN